MSTCKYCELEGRHSALCPANTIIELHAKVESLTKHLHEARMAAAKYEAEPIAAWLYSKWIGRGYMECLSQLQPTPDCDIQTEFIKRPSSTEHLDAKIAEAVAKEQERCAEYALDWFSASQCPDMSLLDYIRARAQKGGV